jgi:hypothetical protein
VVAENDILPSQLMKVIPQQHDFEVLAISIRRVQGFDRGLQAIPAEHYFQGAVVTIAQSAVSQR